MSVSQTTKHVICFIGAISTYSFLHMNFFAGPYILTRVPKEALPMIEAMKAQQALLADADSRAYKNRVIMRRDQRPEYIQKWFGDKDDFPLTINSEYLIQPRSFCPIGKPIDYMIMVHSATSHFSRRTAIRETFGQQGIFRQVTQRVVFLLGEATDPVTSDRIVSEADEWDDIVQGPFIDSYRNLTLKGVMGFRWISENCPEINVLLKIDDDSFVNVFRVIKTLIPTIITNPSQIGCQVHPKDMRKIQRNEGETWKVDEDVFPGLTHYPFDRCNGFFVALTGDLMRPLVDAASVNPFFWIDDAYLFGMLPYTVGDVTFVNLWRDMSMDFKEGKQCIEDKGVSCEYVVVRAGHNTDATDDKDFYNFWKAITSRWTEEDKRQYRVSDKILH